MVCAELNSWPGADAKVMLPEPIAEAAASASRRLQECLCVGARRGLDGAVRRGACVVRGHRHHVVRDVTEIPPLPRSSC